MNVYIEGDRSWFLSKTAVDRFKTDIRGLQSDNFDSVDSSRYLKEGYVFNITKNENNISCFMVGVYSKSSTMRFLTSENSKSVQDGVLSENGNIDVNVIALKFSME